MSRVQEIEEIIFLNYKEGDIFTTTDIKKLAVQNGIINENDNNAVSNTLFGLKNDIRIRRIGRGRYQITIKILDLMKMNQLKSFLSNSLVG